MVGEVAMQRGQIGQVEAAVQRRQDGVAQRRAIG